MLNMKKNNTAAKLEVENRRMEDRLRVLKEMMSAEKARREQDGGIYWQSGRSGPLKNRQPPNSTPSKQTQNGKPVKVKILSEKNGGKDLAEQKSVPRCGQCERSSASLSCVECIENYCQVCFTRVHQKGALSRHHVKPILSNIRQITRKTVPNPEAPLPKNPPSVRPPGNSKPSLLDGKYDEDSSAKSFQLALAEWRNGKSGPSDHTSKVLNTHATKDASTAGKFEASTMTGAGNLPVAQKKLSIEFSDTNKVTYYERMLMRKYQDGSMERDPPRPNGLTEHSTSSEEATKEEEDVEEPLQSGISQYNVFYDIDVMPAEDIPTEGDEGSQCEPVLSSEDFGECKPPLRVSIEQVSFKELNVMDEAPSQASEQPPAKELKQKESKLRNASKEQLTAGKEQDDKQLNASSPTQKPTMQRKSEKKKKTGGRTIQAVNPPVLSEAIPSEGMSSSKQQHQLPDLTDSVKAAWKTCSQADHTPQSLTHFFLHGVCPTDDKEEEVVTPQPTDNINTSPTTEASGGGDDDTTSKFKLGSTIWLPHSSIVMTAAQESDKSPSNQPTDAPLDAVTPPPPLSRPATSQRRDPYYDDTDSDSEPENEREEFISSRLGMTREEFISSRLGMARDSVEWNERAVTPATPHPDLQGKKEEEGEEEEERERADCEALEELACELASTVECEGRLTRNEGTIESSDHQEDMELDHEGAAGTSEGAEGGETDWMSAAAGGEMMEPEMSKVMSEFELYQRDLMEADSD